LARDLIDLLIVGAGFGHEFLHLYREHPLVGEVGLCDLRADAVASFAASHGLDATYSSLDDALASGRWDAVHIATPVHLHVEQTIAVLASGRACASAVPMATSLDGIARVMDAAADGTYMMMETALYQREYLHALALRDSGALGRIGYLSGAHMQDLDGFPQYWMGYAPMQYATHIIAPLLGLASTVAESVSCLGSGRLLPSHAGDGTNPFPIESALFRLAGDERLAAQVTMSFFENARSYSEGFNVYGDLGALEWPSVEGGPAVTYTAGPQDGAHRGRPIERSELRVRDRVEDLPAELRRFTRPGEWTPQGLPPVRVEAWHGGSHPHLVHEFVSAVHEGRASAIDERVAASVTAPGIVAHESALLGGAMLEVPRY
jgi:predicted dehydrogenase